MVDAFSGANYLSLPVLWVGLFLFFYLKAVRWKWLLKPLSDYNLREVVPPMMIGFMGNNIYPAHLGDLMRVYLFAKQQKQPYIAIFSGIVLERILDIIALLGMTGCALAFLPEVNPQVRQGSLIFAAATVIGILLLFLYVFYTNSFLKVCKRLLSFLPKHFCDSILRQLDLGARGFGALRDARLILMMLGNSFLQWGVNAGTIYAALWGFGVSISPLAACLVLGVTAFGVMLPSSPGFFGVIQVCFKETLVPLGVDPTTAVAASIYYQLSQYFPVTISGFYYLWKSGLHLKDLEEAESLQDS